MDDSAPRCTRDVVDVAENTGEDTQGCGRDHSARAHWPGAANVKTQETKSAESSSRSRYSLASCRSATARCGSGWLERQIEKPPRGPRSACPVETRLSPYHALTARIGVECRRRSCRHAWGMESPKGNGCSAYGWPRLTCRSSWSRRAGRSQMSSAIVSKAHIQRIFAAGANDSSRKSENLLANPVGGGVHSSRANKALVSFACRRLGEGESKHSGNPTCRARSLSGGRCAERQASRWRDRPTGSPSHGRKRESAVAPRWSVILLPACIRHLAQVRPSRLERREGSSTTYRLAPSIPILGAQPKETM